MVGKVPMTAVSVLWIKSAKQQIDKFNSYVFDNSDISPFSFLEKNNETASNTIIVIGTVTKTSSGTASGTTPGKEPVYFSDCFLGYCSTAYLNASWTIYWTLIYLNEYFENSYLEIKKINIKKCSHYYLHSTVPFSAPPPLFTIILALHIVVTCVLQNHYGIEHDPFLAFGEFPLFLWSRNLLL